jgi:hypothetical protein
MGQPPQTKGHGHKETWFYEIGPDDARNVLIVEFADGKVTRSHSLLSDAKRQKDAKDVSDHLTVPLSGWISQTASGEPGCLSLHEMAFRRDAQRGWGGLLGAGRNAYLGVSSRLVGVEFTLNFWAEYPERLSKGLRWGAVGGYSASASPPKRSTTK